MAQTDNFKTVDDPKLSIALPSLDKTRCLTEIREEFDTLKDSGTWSQSCQKPGSRRVLLSGIVLKVKRDASGIKVRYKARLVARCDFKSDPVDYGERNPPVACIKLVGVMLAIAVSKGWTIHQLDVKCAFFHANLPSCENIWIRLPSIPGVYTTNLRTVKLKQSL